MTAATATSTTFRLSIRTWGLRTGLPAETVSGAARRLRKRGVMVRVSGSMPASSTMPPRGAKYSVRSPLTRTDRSTPPVLPAQVRGMEPRGLTDPWSADLLVHDGFRAWALGCAGWMIAHWLDPLEPIRASDLSRATGMNYDRVRAVLGDMQRAHIARAVPGGWIRAEDDEMIVLLDAVAVMMNTAESLEHDRDRYERERREHRGPGVPLSAGVPGIDWWSTWWESLQEEGAHRVAA